jgi:SagB-type dehydrogenase family enzyme
MDELLDQVLMYHTATKHHFGRFARGPRYLDWATQPNPFHRYRGAPVLDLEQIAPGEFPRYNQAFYVGHVEPAPLDRRTVSQLFFDSLAISAWKQAGDTSWALRVNPSSGNLHPTEGYLLCGPAEGLTRQPLVAHYAPGEHALEVRAEIPPETWQALTADLPAGTVLLGLSSIHWREAWKYGERAFRYCQHDVGHALAAISLAAAGLGWQVTLLDDLGSEQVAGLLGLSVLQQAEAEHPDCLLAVHPQGTTCARLTLPEKPVDDFAGLSWQGKPNLLSPTHVAWSIIDEVATASEKPPTHSVYQETSVASGEKHAGTASEVSGSSTLSLRQIIRQRRSAVAMDPRGSLSRDAFYQILHKTLAGPGQYPFAALPWHPLVHLALFVHHVDGMAPGLYLLLRDPAQVGMLQAAMKDEFAWEKPASRQAGLPLYRLAVGDVRAIAGQLSCGQAIAADGCFSLGMLARFEEPLARFGPWFYRRLFWECGMIGQILYLEAEAAGVRGTGIGCFFDDAVHQLLGLEDMAYQSLYHFTVGHPVEDARLTTLPAYPAAKANPTSF